MRHHQKRFILIFIIIVVLIVLGILYFTSVYRLPKNIISRFFTQTALAMEPNEEYLQDFFSQLKINEDNTVDVSERLIYNFGDQVRHGIFREIPYKYSVKGGNFTVGLEVLSVMDENNQPYVYSVSRALGKVKIQIGDLSQTVSGIKTYVISYRLNRVINFLDDHDELYWNVTGNDWPVVIDRAGVKVLLPQSTAAEDLLMSCFTGALGETTQDCQISNVTENSVGYNVYKTLAPGQGFTIVLGWPKGVLRPPTAFQQIYWVLKDNPLLPLPLLVFALMYVLWFFHGRDLGAKRSIIPNYEAPDNLLPAEVGSLIDERVNLTDLSATLIDLAVRGYIKISELPKNDWELIKLKDFVDLKDWELSYISAIFADKTAIKISDLKNQLPSKLGKIKSEVYRALVQKNYFPVSPAKVRQKYQLAALALFFAGIIVTPFFGSGLNTVALLISGLVVFWLGQYMPYKTREGTRAHQDILGYKMYLSVAEKDRINFHNAPQKNPQLFEKHLPFAMVLGVEKKWAKEFENIYLNQPSWYQGNFAAFNAFILVDSLNGLNSSVKSAMITQSSGAAAGHSGFSGGGFGGGGGGSW